MRLKPEKTIIRMKKIKKRTVPLFSRTVQKQNEIA
jgi:hypothetical protein